MPPPLPVFICATLIIDIFLALGVIIGIRLYKNLKNEEHQEQGKVIQRIMKTYTVLQCVAWPVVLTCMGLLRFNKLLIKFLTPSLERHAICVLRSLFLLFRYYIGFNSFIIAICRYCFIVFDGKTSDIGVGKARKILLGSSFGIPLLLAVFSEATVSMQHGWIALSTTENIFQSPIYQLVRHLFPDFITYVIELCCISLIGIIFSNIIEGLIYFHIYIYCRR